MYFHHLGEAMGEQQSIAVAPCSDTFSTRQDTEYFNQQIEDEARLIIFNPWVMLLSQGAFFGVCGLIWLMFEPVVPAFEMKFWCGIMVALLLIIIVFDIAFFKLAPGDPARMRLFRAVDKKQTILFDVVAVGVIGLLLPHGNEAHRMVITAFCVGYVPLQMISDPENTFGNRFSIFAVLGSFTLFLLRYGGPNAGILVGMVVIYGATLFYAAEKFRFVVVEALRNRRELEIFNAQLSDALQEVSRERDAKTRFISSASHDLGQPIQAASLFLEQVMTAHDEIRRNRALGCLASSIESAQSMLGHMLYSMRLEADAVVPVLQKCELRAILQGIVTRFESRATQAGMEIKLDCRERIVCTDSVLLERAVGNLLDNAIVHSGATQLLVSAQFVEKYFSISVADDGVGIAAGDHSGLFDDYSQGSNSRSTTRSGFGLGLASVRRIAGLFGGGVHVENPASGGARFVITLPIDAV